VSQDDAVSIPPRRGSSRRDAATARSWLFVPGDRPDRFAKAVGSGADAVILDLEDAVAGPAKSLARQHVTDWLTSGGQGWVRVNILGTPDHALDIAALDEAPGLQGVVIAKAGSADSVGVVTAALAGVPVIPLLETATGLGQVTAIAQCTGVVRLAFGSLDFANDIGASSDDDALLYARSAIVLAARLAGLPAPIDGVTTALHDVALVAADTRHALRLGFGAKLAIHPDQIAAIHAGLLPDADETSWAQAVLAGGDSAGGAAALGGTMVDLPLVHRAQSILLRAEG
jgi:citrate lyase subunit beta/citryl-CoA lyase